MNRRDFFQSGAGGLLAAAGVTQAASGETQSPWHLLTDPRLQYIKGGRLFPAVVFMDGKRVADVTELIAIPCPMCPAFGAVRRALRNEKGKFYLVGRELAREWLFGAVAWRPATEEDRNDPVDGSPAAGRGTREGGPA